MPQRKTTQEFEKEIDGIFHGEYELVGEYINSKTNVILKHTKCGTLIKRFPPSILSSQHCNCPKCDKNTGGKIYVGINDIMTKRPDLISLLYHVEDAKKFTPYSSKYTYFVCPACGEILYKNISNVANQGLSCDKCGDGISYPEKFMYELLEQLQIPFCFQFSPKWITKRKYDFEFCNNNQKYIIEMDGGFHYKDSIISNLNNVLTNDNYKDDMAVKNGYHVIRINCDYSSNTKYTKFEYIKNSICNSYLSVLFDLNRIDFDKCDAMASKSTLVKIADLWNSGVHGIKNIQKVYQHDRSTIRNYLKNASEIGLIKDDYETIKRINRKMQGKNISESKGQKVLCNETGEVFNTYGEANKKYNAELSGYFGRNGKYSGRLIDGTRLTWSKI